MPSYLINTAIEKPRVLPFLRNGPMEDRALVVLAFGQVSLLEIHSIFQHRLLNAEMICDRVASVHFARIEADQIKRLAGIHKFASPVAVIDDHNYEESIAIFVKKILDYYDNIPNVSVSSYCGGDSPLRYDDVVASVLTNIREMGFRKTNLLRPRDQELTADEILSRRALDFVDATSDHHLLATTIFVPDSEAFRQRGMRRPIAGSGMALSPRLARTLVNLSGLSKGETLLDPFCGSGTIISEGALLSMNCIGLDANPTRVAQARRNLAWLEKQSAKALSHRIETGDARNLEATSRVDGIVTEPILLPKFSSTPSPQRAKKLVQNASRIYSESLYSMAKVVRKAGRIVIVVPAVKTTDGSEVLLRLEGMDQIGFREFQPGQTRFVYPLRVGFESTRWVGRGVYVFERT